MGGIGMTTGPASASATPVPRSDARYSRRLRWGGFLVGFGLGGFFDGIVLHQILQWHHLLSALESGALGDLRGQVIADGAFHALMYLVTAAGLWLLVKARHDLGAQQSSHRLASHLLVGFGVWHVLDAVFSHWITGIHRIRMGVDNPLTYDLWWLAVTGLVPLALGVFLRRNMRTGKGPSAPGARTTATLLLLGSASLLAGAVNLWPVNRAADPSMVTVVLRPGVPAPRLLAGLGQSDSRVVWSDAEGAVWVLKLDERIGILDLYRHGAMYVSGSTLPAGCTSWFVI
jgi:uncharacterized membrane protein